MRRVPGIGKGVHGVQFVVCAASGEEEGHLAFSPALLQFFLLLIGQEIADILLERQPERTQKAQCQHPKKHNARHTLMRGQVVVDMQD